MLRGLYSVAGALDVATRNHEVVSENLANITTPGYRRQGTFFDMPAASAEPQSPLTPGSPRIAPPRPASFTRFENGPMQQTNSPLDVALSGNGYFVLESPTGPVYTRNGTFELGPNGELRSSGNGFRVRGQGAPITLPPNASQIRISADGTIVANGAQVGQLELATFDRPETLRRVGATLFQGDSPRTPDPGSVRVEQGFREGSNVQAVQEMVSMMIGMRHYEAAEKSLRAITDAIGQNTRTQA